MPSLFDSRLLATRDLDAAARLFTESYPHRGHEPAWWQRSAPREQARRWGIFDEADSPQQPAEHLIGYAALWNVVGRKFRFDIIVSPEHRRRGHGNHLFEVIRREATEMGAETLQARAYAMATESLAFLARRRFVETMRMRGFVLPLLGIDVDSIMAAANSCSAPDVSIVAVSRSQYTNSKFWNRLAEAHDASREGWPDPDPGGPPMPTDPTTLRRMLMPSPASAIAFFVALRGDRLLGYSLLGGRRDTGEAQFASTAVRPAMRGQKIATAMRARCVLTAREAGFSAVRSASGNAALIRINVRFGFQDTYSEVRLVRRRD
jgi:N-acetylglutamate synthase and related acetyltransferases